MTPRQFQRSSYHTTGAVYPGIVGFSVFSARGPSCAGAADPVAEGVGATVEVMVRMGVTSFRYFYQGSM